ncbi:hypothetical protein FKM82_014827 [Ascaphus truei]
MRCSSFSLSLSLSPCPFLFVLSLSLLPPSLSLSLPLLSVTSPCAPSPPLFPLLSLSPSFTSQALLLPGPVTRVSLKMEALLNQWLWRHEYWLPAGVTWEDMKDTEEIRYPRPRDLLLTIPCTLIFTAVRFLFERFVALPLSRQLGIREKYGRKPPAIPVLEAFYAKQRKKPTEAEVCSLSVQCNMLSRQVEKWFRCRRNQDRPTTSKKFCEASWRFVFYLFSFITGLTVLYDKPWLWNQREFWTEYPYQPLILSLYWYYMLQLGFYWSLLLTVAFDVKRKDLKEQIVHHFATIFLIMFSYCANYIRAGTLVMLLHDAADHILEGHLQHLLLLHGNVPAVLWILLFQRSPDGPADTPRFLGIPDPTRGL